MAELTRAPSAPVLHPGEHLKDYLDSQAITQAEFARRAGVSEKHVSQIVSGKAGITAGMAIAIERVLGGGATMWVNLDARHRLWKAERDERERLGELTAWARSFPLADLRKRGAIAAPRVSAELVAELLSFFGVHDRPQWDAVYGSIAARFRRSKALEVSAESQAAYLRLCERKATVWDLPPFDRARLEQALDEVRARLEEPSPVLFRAACDLLAHAGVALVAEPATARSGLSGAAFWPRTSRAVLALTGRFRTADHLWFSFFHEAAHLLLHRDRDVLEVDGGEGDLEAEADRYARDVLLPAGAYHDLMTERPLSLPRIRSTADAYALPVDCLIGMLQHDGLVPHREYRKLKRPVTIGELSQ